MANIKHEFKFRRKGSNKTSVTVGVFILIAVISFFVNLSGIYTVDDFLVTLGLKEPSLLGTGKVTVHYIDVGQGDCQLIMSGDKTVLIDAGERGEAKKVIHYLEKYGVEKLDYIIATHPHDDHIGGLAKVIEEFEVGTIYAPEIPEDMISTTRSYEDFLTAISEKGLTLTSPDFCEEIDLGMSSLTLYPPQKDYESINNYSIVSYFKHGRNTFLFTGDIESEAENDLIKTDRKTYPNFSLNSVVLKVAHHGSSSSSTQKFLNYVLPDLAVIQCGENNRYNHPNQEVVDRLYINPEMMVLRNDLVGDIVLISEKNEIQISLEKGNINDYDR